MTHQFYVRMHHDPPSHFHVDVTKGTAGSDTVGRESVITTVKVASASSASGRAFTNTTTKEAGADRGLVMRRVETL